MMATGSPSKPRALWIVSAIMMDRVGILLRLNCVYADSIQPLIYTKGISEQMKLGVSLIRLADQTCQIHYKFEPISILIALPICWFDLTISALSQSQANQIANRIEKPRNAKRDLPFRVVFII